MGCRLSLMDLKLKAEKFKDFIPGYITKHSTDMVNSLTSAEDTLNKAIEESRGDVSNLSKLLDNVVV